MKPKGDHRKILETLRQAMQRRGVQDFSRSSKIGSTTLYQATHPGHGNPSLQTLCRIINALGYQFSVRPKKGKAAPPEGYPKVRAAEATEAVDAPAV